jgi:F0F1-type ATP synthase membrane subunit b/b'
MREFWEAVAGEISGHPRQLIVEVAQSLLLITLIVWYGRRLARRRLSGRRDRIEAELAAAAAADVESVRLRDEAQRVIAAIGQTGPLQEQEAIGEAERERDASLVQAEARARELVAEARRTVEMDRDRIRRESADRLLALTTEITRRYLDEILNEDERRALTRQAIRASLAAIDSSGNGRSVT